MLFSIYNNFWLTKWNILELVSSWQAGKGLGSFWNAFQRFWTFYVIFKITEIFYDLKFKFCEVGCSELKVEYEENEDDNSEFF